MTVTWFPNGLKTSIVESDGTISFTTGDTGDVEALTISPNGEVNIQTLYINQLVPIYVTGFLSEGIQIIGSGPGSEFSVMEFSNDTNAAFFTFGKSRGSVTSPAALVASDPIHYVRYGGDDGSTPGAIPVLGATQAVAVDGAVSAGVVPMRFIWNTMNAAGVSAERLRLHSSGGLSLGSQTDPGVGNLRLSGQIVTGTSTPASATATGIAGTIAWDTNFIYVCTATNTWKRAAIATW